MRAVLALVVLGRPATGVAQDYFQGTCIYRVTARSKLTGVSDSDIFKVLTIGDRLTMTIKGGNYRLTSRYAETFILKDDHREYIKFPAIDTVFYLDFSSDTDKVTGILRNNAVVKVGGYPCKGITIETSKVSRQYLYSTTIRTNPDDDYDNTLEQAGVYSAETAGGLKLWVHTEYPSATEVDSCVRVERKAVSDGIFRLPDLPISPLFGALRIFFPRFPGGDTAWRAFVGSVADARLVEKYVKPGKGEKDAWQTVIVAFTVAVDGKVSDAHVVNAEEVNPKLAAEAIRVMRLSPKWIPASFYGEKVRWTTEEAVGFSMRHPQ